MRAIAVPKQVPSLAPEAPRLDLRAHVHAPPAALSGVALYAERLHRELTRLVDATLVRRQAREWRIAGKVVGGTATRLLSRAVSIGRGELVHAVDPMSAPVWGRLDVLTVHDVLSLQHPELYGRRQADVDRRLLRAALAKEPLVATPTHAARAALLGHVEYDPERVFVSSHGVDARVLAGAAGPAPHVLDGRLPTILVNMDDDPRKRTDVLIEACRDLPVRVVHVGARRHGYPAHTTRVERASHALSGRYVRLERVDAATLGALYAHCDLYVHLTHGEGFGMPPVEAMACGARVLASDVGVMREVLGAHARYVAIEPGVVRETIRAILAREPVTRASTAHARGYTWAKHAREMAGLYLRARHPDNPAAWTGL